MHMPSLASQTLPSLAEVGLACETSICHALCMQPRAPLARFSTRVGGVWGRDRKLGAGLIDLLCLVQCQWWRSYGMPVIKILHVCSFSSEDPVSEVVYNASQQMDILGLC